MMSEKTLESPFDTEIKPVNPKGNQPWIFIGRTDAEAEASILWHWIQKADSLEKILMLGKTEGKNRSGWQRMRWLDSITDSMDMSEQTVGVSEGQGSLTCCSSWGHKEIQLSDCTTITRKNTCRYLKIMNSKKISFRWKRLPGKEEPGVQIWRIYMSEDTQRKREWWSGKEWKYHKEKKVS